MFRLYRNKKMIGVVILLFLAPAVATAQMAWVKNFDDALKQASSEKKFIVLDISASW